MFSLSENYHLRKCFLQQEQVPTQSMIKKKMTPPLADVYFKSMTPKLKELAGLEPSLKGGGNDWYVPPEELLNGRTVLKPVRKKILDKLNHLGIDDVGTSLWERRNKVLDMKKKQVLIDADAEWRNTVTEISSKQFADLSETYKQRNTELMTNDFNSFAHLYRQSLDKIETLFHESVIADIKNTRENAIQIMRNKYTIVLKCQATLLYDEYEKKLMEEIARLKAEFINKLENIRTEMGDKIHDYNVDKHIAIAKFRQFLECQNLACEIYIALKEREECQKEIEESKHKHRKTIRTMTKEIVMKDYKIYLERQHEKKGQKIYYSWKNKICRVLKNLEKFVSYCLSMLPEHAEFFINMEKMMLLQIEKAMEDPAAESIIEVEEEKFHTPVPQPKPFYLFCDKGYKAKVDQDLCPRHSGTSSASQLLPAIIINKRCLYAACDNFEQFDNKVQDFINGNRGQDADVKDDLVYEHFVPVKHTSSQQLLQNKLKSSLLQVLQQEIAHIQTESDNIPDKCIYCQLPWCSCTSRGSTLGDRPDIIKLKSPSKQSFSALSYTSTDLQTIELDHEREPKWESFCNYVEPKTCSCAKTAKKHLVKHLPVYMRQMKYGPPDIPGYEICTFKTLKSLVKEARKEIPPVPVPSVVPSNTTDISTQYSDQEFQNLCSCLTDPMIDRLEGTLDFTRCRSMCVSDPSKTPSGPSNVLQGASSFATARVTSLKNLIAESAELKYIFKNDCDSV